MGIFKDNVSFQNGRMVIIEDGEVQETITTSDTKQFFAQAINKYFMTADPDADTQWQEIFRVIPGSGHGELLPYRPADTTTTVSATASFLAAENANSSGSHGIVFEEVGEGGEILFNKVTSAEKYVRHVKYGAAINYSTEWFEDGSMGLIEMTTEDFRRAANDKMAAIHYAAIGAAVQSGISTNVDVNAQVGTSNTAQLLNGLNETVAAMQRNKVRATHLLIAPENEGPVRLALKYRQEGGPVPLVQNSRVSSLKLLVSEYIAAGTGFVVEAKRRLVSTNRQPLSLGDFEDLLHDSHALVGKFRRGVLVGEGNVIRGLTNIHEDLLRATVDDF